MTDNPLRLFLDEEPGARDKACKARKNSMPSYWFWGLSLILSCEVGGGEVTGSNDAPCGLYLLGSTPASINLRDL